MTAPVSVREKVAFGNEQVAQALHCLLEDHAVSEAAILSTCNRTEIYTQGISPQRIISWLSDFHSLPSQDLTPYLYHHRAQHAVTHVMRVACGLDSLVIGESQILGQLKHAVAQAKEVGTIRRHLGRLFDSAFAVAKRVRAETPIGRETLSVAFAAVKLAGHIFSDITKNHVLLVGAGETIELVANYFKQQGVSRFTVANRTPQTAMNIAKRIGGQGIALSDLAKYLDQADVVVTATASSLPIIGKGMIENALRQRKHKPMLLIDLAVPRDIEAQVAKLSDIYLYTVDDLQSVIEDNLQSRKKAAVEAQAIIDVHAARFMDWLQAQTHLGLLRDYRQNALMTRDTLTQKALAAIARGEDVESALKRMSYALTNKLIHPPTHSLREAALRGDETTLQIAATLLGIKETS